MEPTGNRHTTIAAHVPRHEKSVIRAAAEKVGARSLSAYMGERVFAAALEDLRGEKPGTGEEGADGG